VEEIKGIPSEFLPETDSSQITNLGVINAWIGQGGLHYHRRHPYGCTHENYFAIITDVAKYLNLNLLNIEDYLPEVNFEKLELYSKIEKTMEEYKKNYKKIIFISNGDVLSEQSMNFDFTPIVESLSSKNLDCLFLLSKKTNIERKNVVFTDDITGIIPDLLYISQISTHCDVIVGRDSGPYCFTHVKENILNPQKKYICFSGNRDSGKFYSGSKVDFIWSSNYNVDNIHNTIQNNI
jgi:hypothetical protein